MHVMCVFVQVTVDVQLDDILVSLHESQVKERLFQ